MERLYRATADTGRDYISFLFKSSHRANSKDNKIDANVAYKKAHGHSVKIIETIMTKYTGEKIY